jgi:hypothetical protein
MPNPTLPITPSRAVYTVADERFFIGVVAMINSLRLMGHGEPILVLDCGLTETQARLLRPEATLVALPRDTPPHLLKHVLPLAKPADTMLLIDADIVATQSLESLFQRAAIAGGVAFADALGDRFEPEWQTLLDLPSLRREPYFNSGLLVLSRKLAETTLGGLRDVGRRADLTRSMTAPGQPADYPLFFLDQDILNAVTSSLVPPGALEVLDYRLVPHPPFPGVELIDPARLECAYSDGVRTFGLHHIQAKPWLADVTPNTYSRLLPRLLLADDVAIQVDPSMLPRKLRSGVLAAAARQRSAAAARLRFLRGSVGVRRRLREAQERLSSTSRSTRGRS